MNLARLLWNYASARRGAARWPDRTALERWQDRRVTAHLRRVLPRSAWLRERFDGRPPGAWREVPVTGKAEAMARFADWNTAGVGWEEALEVALRAEETRDFSPLLRGFTVGLSSGTSGGRGVFLASAAERDAWAGTMLGKVLPRPAVAAAGASSRVFSFRQAADCFVPGRHRVALFLRAGGGLYEAAGQGRVTFCWFDLMQPAASHWDALERFDPTVLVAPPSLLAVLWKAGRALRPRKVVSVAETLDALDRAALAEAFGMPVHEVYQATEGFLAASDAEGVLRLNEDGMVVEREWLDAGRTRFVPVITDFRRTTQPVIRHRLDDVLVVREEAGPEAVFTGLAALEGRSEDSLWAVAKGGARQRVFGDSVVRAVIRAAAVEDFRVWQCGAGRLEVALIPDGILNREAVAQGLRRLWQDAGAAVQVDFVRMPEAEAPGVKRRRVRQLWRESG